MPRKQNGWGTSKSFAFKGAGRIDRGKGVGSFGLYPGDRRYGSSVHRTVIEKWNLDSNWVKWRKGFEIYNLTSWAVVKVANSDPDAQPAYVPASLKSVLYQGTDYEIPTTFMAYEFPTANADGNTHYVAKRTPEEKLLGVVTEVQNDEITYATEKANHEIHVRGIPDAINARLLLQMLGERLTDGSKDEDRTEATLKNVLTADKLPGIYKGKTAPKSVTGDSEFLKPTIVRISIPLPDLVQPENPKTYIRNQGLFGREVKAPKQIDILENPNQLIGKLIYIKNFYIERPISELDSIEWAEDSNYMAATIVESERIQTVYALDPGVSNLPPSMYDIDTLPKIFETNYAEYTVEGTYVFKKEMYQKYFGKQYLSCETVKDLVQDISYVVLPFMIKSAGVLDNKLYITSEPFVSEVTLTPELTEGSYLVFTDKSFCKFTQTDTKWTDLNTDVNPWMDEIFTSGKALRPAEVYTCSCPSHSHAILSVPQAIESIGDRKINRQLRYPLPTVMSQDRYVGAGLEQTAGKISSWETLEHRLGYKMCKHTIAAMFIENIRVKEPSEYPTAEARIEFDEKLADMVNSSRENFIASYKLGGISLKEIIFALAQGLNLDNTETAYVIFRSS